MSSSACVDIGNMFYFQTSSVMCNVYSAPFENDFVSFRFLSDLRSNKYEQTSVRVKRGRR